MGKRVIFNTVFNNPIDVINWIINRNDVIEMDVSELGHVTQIANNHGFADINYENLQGKRIKKIRLLSSGAGTLSILKFSQNALTTPGIPTVIQQLQITSEMVGVPTIFDVDINVGDSDIIGVGLPTDSTSVYFLGQQTENSCYIKLDNEGRTPIPYGSILAISWGVEN